MSAPRHRDARVAWQRLPPWLRPREREQARQRAAAGWSRRSCSLLVGLLLAIATVNDVVRQTHVNHRLVADLRTWRAYTGHDYKNVSIEQDMLQPHARRDVVCGNTVARAAERTHPALPAADRAGRATGGDGARRLVPAAEAEDLRRYRYGCFGAAQARRGLPAVSAVAAARRGRRRRAARRRAGRAWWPLAALIAAGGGAAPLDARPAELLVRRGVHARARAAPEPRRDAARGRAHREHAAAVVPARVGDARVLGTGAVALRLPSALAGIATVPVAWAIGRELAGRRARRSPRRRSSRSTRCSCGTRRRRARTGCSCSRPRWRCCASCAR